MSVPEISDYFTFQGILLTFDLMPKCPTCGRPIEWKDNEWRPFEQYRKQQIDEAYQNSVKFLRETRQKSAMNSSSFLPQVFGRFRPA